MIFLFLLVIGGLYGGVFPPTIAGAIGAAGTIVYAFVMGRMNWSKLYNAFWESAKVGASLI